MGKTEREHPRYAHEAVVTMHVGGQVHQGRTTNVSRGGVCADLSALPAPLAIGTEVELDMQLVFDDDVQSDALRVPARIVWCTAVEDIYQIGVAFKPMPAERAQLLAMFLRYLDDSGPRTKQPKVERSVDDQFR